MALNLGPLNVLLNLKGERQFTQGAGRAAEAVSSLGSKIAGLVGAYQMISVITEATRVFAEFERGMVRVGAVTNSLGTSAFAGLTDRAQDLARTTEFTARQVGDAMGFMGMAGMSTNQIYDATPAVLQLASAGMIDVAKAADVVTNIMAGYGIQTEDLNDANNILVATFTGSNTSLESLGQSFKYAGSVAKNAGVDFKEAAAVIGLMGNAGIQADMAGTALRGAIIKLLSPTDQGAEIMRRYGINVKDSSGKLKSMVEIFRQFEPIADDSAAMVEMFGLRAGPGLQAALSQGTGALEKLIKKIDDAGNIAERIAEAQLDTLDGKIKIMKSNAEALQIAFGQALEPTTEAFVNALSEAAQFAKYIVDTISFVREEASDTSAIEAEMSKLATQRAKATQQLVGLQKAIAGGYADVFMQEKLAGFGGISAEAATGGLEMQIDELTQQIANLGKKGFGIELPKPPGAKPPGGGGDGDDDGDKSKKAKKAIEATVTSRLVGVMDVGADMMQAEFDDLMASFGFANEIIIEHAKVLDEATLAALDFADQMGAAIASLAQGRLGATYGPEIGNMIGTAIGSMIPVPGAAQAGGMIGSVIGSIAGDAFDQLIDALGVLTPIFELIGDIIGTLSAPLSVIGSIFGMLADSIGALVIPQLELFFGIIAKLLYPIGILIQAILPLVNIFGLLINVLFGGLLPVFDLVASVFQFLGEQVLIPFAKVMIGAYNSVVDFINGITNWVRSIEIAGEKPFASFGVILGHLSTDVLTYAETIADENDAREEATATLREFSEELRNVPIGVKRLRALQFNATRGSVAFPGRFNAPAFGA